MKKKELLKELKNLKFRIWVLENPPKFKYADNVIMTTVTWDHEKEESGPHKVLSCMAIDSPCYTDNWRYTLDAGNRIIADVPEMNITLYIPK